MMTTEQYRMLVNTVMIIERSGADKLLTPEQAQKLERIKRAIRLHDELLALRGKQ